MSRRSTILVAVDGSTESDAAAAWAARECPLRAAWLDDDPSTPMMMPRSPADF
jgi:hypothetical protein